MLDFYDIKKISESSLDFWIDYAIFLSEKGDVLWHYLHNNVIVFDKVYDSNYDFDPRRLPNGWYKHEFSKDVYHVWLILSETKRYQIVAFRPITIHD